MTEYKPTEYVVDFGDYRSNQFVRLNMALIEQNSAKLHERIIRCRDCKWCMAYAHATYCDRFEHSLPTVNLDGFCAWGEKRG